jgi:hypothetical protein
MFEGAMCKLKCGLDHNVATPEDLDQGRLLAYVVNRAIWATTRVDDLVPSQLR